jgi:starch phosphorylase
MPEFRQSIVFLENYDMTIAHYMVQGVDVWLNNPRRPKEASGTSGMKVIYNGGLNLSVLDGWWDEAYEPELGWAIGSGEEYAPEDEELQDYIESQALYNLLEKDVIPLFYGRGRDRMLPRGWVSKVKTNIRKLAAFFSTDRMLEQYTNEYYMPCLKRYQELIEKDVQDGLKYAKWLIHAEKDWKGIKILSVDVSDPNVSVGADLEVEATINLDKFKPDEVSVQLYAGKLDTSDMMIGGEYVLMEPEGKPKSNVYKFRGKMNFARTGRLGISVRVLPHHDHLADPVLTGLITWADK